MKKLFVIMALSALSATAFAADVGLRYGHSGSLGTPAIGVTLGQKFGGVGVEGAFDRATAGAVNVNRYSVIGSYDLVKLGGVTVAGKAGVAYVDPSVGRTGYAGLVGVGASFPLSKSVNLVADYSYQRGQNSVRALDGNIVSVGVKYSF